MKNIIIAVFGGGAMLCGLAAGYFFSQGTQNYGWLFVVIALILLLLLRSRLRAMRTPAEKAAKALEHPAMNLAFYSELSRLIDEGTDINAYLRSCGAPENMIKSVNIGGSSTWYYHRDGAPYDEFCAEFPLGETPFISHPCVKSQRVTDDVSAAVHTVTVDLHRALWDWGEQHPEKRRYANSMRIAFHGAYDTSEGKDDNSFLDKSIDEVRSARKANKKNPNKKKNRKTNEESK